LKKSLTNLAHPCLKGCHQRILEVNISRLQTKVVRLEQELERTRQQLAHATHDSTTLTAELVQSRAYAFDSKTLSVEEVLEGCVNSLESYGFCVVENVISTEEVSVIRQEIIEAQKRSAEIFRPSTN
jgi:hypothetical protein